MPDALQMSDLYALAEPVEEERSFFYRPKFALVNAGILKRNARL